MPAPVLCILGKKGIDMKYQDVEIGDIVNIKTSMTRRAHMIRYRVISKPDAPGYGGLRIEKPEGGSIMFIPGLIITSIETV